MKAHEKSILPRKDYSTSEFGYPKNFLIFAKSLSMAFPLVLTWLVGQGFVSGGLFQIVAGGGLGSGDGAGIFLVVVLLSFDAIRGLIQRIVSRLLGYEVSFSSLLSAYIQGTYIADPGQLQPRRDALLVALAPLCLFVLVSIPLLFGLQGSFSHFFAFFLMVSILGTVWDLYFVWWLLRKPQGTMLYAKSFFRFTVFTPRLNRS